jgi:hypothetical protein
MHASKEINYVRQAQQLEHKHDWCAQQATIANQQSEFLRGRSWDRLASSTGAIAHDLRRLAAHESRLKRTYERAARHRWLDVALDSPPRE